MHIHFLPESWKWKMGVSPIRLTFQISSHFPLNHDFGRKSIYENANLKPATCYIWLLIVLVISTWWRVVSYESHHVKRKRVKWTKSGAQNDTFNSLYGDPVGDRCYFSSTNPLLQGSIHIWYIYTSYMYILLYICVYLYFYVTIYFHSYIQIHPKQDVPKSALESLTTLASSKALRIIEAKGVRNCTNNVAFVVEAKHVLSRNNKTKHRGKAPKHEKSFGGFGG